MTVPPVIYHYTSMEGLLGIIKGCIWATNIRYLNDISEYDHFLTLVRGRMPELGRHKVFPHPQLNKSELISKLIRRRKPHLPAYMDLPFVASFSRDRDSLVHWRSYCAQGNGVCVGLKSAWLRKAFLEHVNENSVFTQLQAITYLRPDDVPSLDRLIGEIYTGSLSMIETLAKAQGRRPTQRNFVDITRAHFEMRAGTIKHYAFRLEREFRLSVTLFGHEAYVLHRPSRSTLNPYLSMRLTDPKIESPPDFIESVTIGPSPNPKLSQDAVRGLCRGRGIDVSVEKSSVPFRDW